jgi:hypothetical protein
VIKTSIFARKNENGRNADRRLANRRLQPLGHLTVRGFPKDLADPRFRKRLLTGHVPASMPKTARRVPQVSIAHDIIAIEDERCFVSL